MIGVLVVGIGVSGCATHPVSFDSSLPGSSSFDRALMAYVHGELEVSLTELNKQQEAFPGDVRVQVLQSAIQREQGNKVDPSVVALAQDRMSGPVTLAQLLQHTQERNVEIRQRIHDVISARAKWREARLSFTPEFFALTRFYPGGFFIRLTQDILGGLIERQLRMHQAEAAILEAVARYAQTYREVQIRMANSYFNLLEAQESMKISQRAIAVAEEHRRVGQVLADEGLMSEDLLSNSQQSLLDLHQLFEVRQGEVMVAQATIQGLLDLPNEAFPGIRMQRVSLTDEAHVDKAIANATQDRPELHAIEAQLKKNVLAQEANRWVLPKINLRSTYGETSDKGKGDFLAGLSIGLSGEVPLLLWPLRKAQSDREQAFVDRLELEVARVKAEVMIETVEAYEEMRVSQSRFYQYQEKAHTRQLEWHALEHRLQEGSEGNQLDVLTAQLAYLRSRQEQVLQQYRQQRAVFALHAVTGSQIDTLIFVDSKETPLVSSETFAEFQSVKRGLWVWQTELALSKQERSFFLSFLQARKIQSVFLFVSKDLLRNEPERVREFLRFAHQKGIEVHALNGEPTWIFEGDRSFAQEFITAVRRYHDKVLPEEQFDALHLDVEPHALPNWNSGERMQLVEHYVEFLDWAAFQVVETSLSLVIDIPYWFDSISIGKENLLEHVWDVADQVAIMAYRNSAAKVIDSVRQEIEIYQSHPKPVWIGLSTESEFWPNGIDTQSVEANFEAMIQDVGSSMSKVGKNLGVSIQDYVHYRDMILSTKNHDQSIDAGDVAVGENPHFVMPVMAGSMGQ